MRDAETLPKKRKKRTDRNHIIYELRVGKLVYIGITYVEGRAVQGSLERRWIKHVRRANTESKTWALCEAIRKFGADAFERKVLAVVRGKTEAHKQERELIRTLKPKLNTDKR